MDKNKSGQSKLSNQSSSEQTPSLPEGFVSTLWQVRSDFQFRWKRNIILLLILGVLVSFVSHLIIAFLLNIYGRSAGLGVKDGSATIIEFAVFDSEYLSELPESTELEDLQSAPSTLESPLTAETTLEVSGSSVSQLISDQSMVPTLGGAGGGDIGGGMGGSGGAGTSFFGIASKGGRFCYILDISSSMNEQMNEQNRLAYAIKELQASLLKLPNFSKFFILFFSSGFTEPPTQHGWNTARRSSLNRILNEIQRVQAFGGTQPADAFERAMELRPLPDVMFFLTDGQIPKNFVEQLRNMMPKNKRIVVHTVAFGASADVKQLKAIATLTGGQYKSVTTRD